MRNSTGIPPGGLGRQLLSRGRDARRHTQTPRENWRPGASSSSIGGGMTAASSSVSIGTLSSSARVHWTTSGDSQRNVGDDELNTTLLARELSWLWTSDEYGLSQNVDSMASIHSQMARAARTSALRSDIEGMKHAVRKGKPAQGLEICNGAITRVEKVASMHVARECSAASISVSSRGGAGANINGNLARLYCMRGLLCTSLGQHEKALDSAESALRLQPNCSRAHYQRGQAQMQLLRTDRAMKSFAHGLQTEPTNARHMTQFLGAMKQVNRDRQFHSSRRGARLRYPQADHDGMIKPKTVEPEEEDDEEGLSSDKKAVEGLTEDWKHIDIADIMHEQNLLRVAILDCIEDGFADPEEAEDIGWQLKRSGVHPTTVKKVKQELDKGELDEEALQVLKSITPPDPSDDWKVILEVLDREQGFLKTIFRFYCLEGSSGMEDVETMGMGQFSRFAKAVHIVCKEDKAKMQTAVMVSTMDRIFLRANQDRSSELDDVLSKNLTKKQKAQKAAAEKKQKAGKGGPDHDLEIHEFAAATIRCAHARYRDASLAARYERLIEENLKKHANFEIEDDLTRMFAEEDIQEVFNKHERGVRRVFNKVAGMDQSAFTAAEMGTVNMKEWIGFLQDAGLMIPGKLTNREARGIFVQVNLDDELFVQACCANPAPAPPAGRRTHVPRLAAFKRCPAPARSMIACVNHSR